MATHFQYAEYAGYRCLCGMEKQTTDLYLTYCGMEQCSPTHSWGPASRPEFHMHFILDGEGYLEIKEEKYHLKKGQIFLLPANIITYYHADPIHPWYYAWVAFNGEKASYYLEQAGFSSGNLIQNCIIAPEDFATIINKMLHANELSAKDEFIRIGCLFHLFSMLIQNNKLTYHSSGLSGNPIEHALQYMEYNYNSDIQISSVAEYVGMKRTHFTNEFKKKMNISPKMYLTQLRMKKSCELLRTTKDSISDVAVKVGYPDPFAFSKMFHQMIGQSPSDYRKTHL